MREQVRARLAELEAELVTGRRLEAELAARLEEVRRDLLRVSGAAQVLDELLQAASTDGEAPPARSPAA